MIAFESFCTVGNMVISFLLTRSKLSEGKFNAVWMDYTIEATENKTLKGSGGIIGLTLRAVSYTHLTLPTKRIV